MSDTASVLVCGSGPTGLTAALVLAQNGVSVRIIEKETTFKPGQKGVTVMPRTFEMHKFMSTFDDVWPESGPVPSMRFYGPDGTTIVREFDMMPKAEATTAIPFPMGRFLGQEGHEAVLRRALDKYGVHVEYGTELVSFTQDSDNVDAVLRHTANGEEEIVRVQWLIGADGARSIVRKSLGLKFLGDEELTQASVIGDIHVYGNISRDYWSMWGEPPKRFVSLIPSEHRSGENANRFTLAFTDQNIPEADLPTNKADLIKFMQEVMNRPDIEFGDVIWMNKWKPNIRMVDTFRSGRVFVAGDAAHCHSPAGAQGMNSSVQDAVNLSWKLSLVVKGIASSELLSTYTTERLPVIAMMLNKTTGLLKKMFSGVEPEKTYNRGGELLQLGVNYRGSPIIVGGKEQFESDTEVIDPYRNTLDGTLAVGDRAPNASVGFFDVFKVTHHTILVFGSSELAEEVVGLVKKWKAPSKVVLVRRAGSVVLKDSGVDYVLEDKDGSAFTNYQVEDKAVVIVRPDGVIGAKAGDASVLDTYCSLMFA